MHIFQATHILGYKKSLSKFKKIELISSVFSEHHGIKLEINHKEKKIEKHTNTWRPKFILLNNEWVNNKNKQDIKRYLNTN